MMTFSRMHFIRGKLCKFVTLGAGRGAGGEQNRIRNISLQISFVNLCQTGAGSMKEVSQRPYSRTITVPRIRKQLNFNFFPQGNIYFLKSSLSDISHRGKPGPGTSQCRGTTEVQVHLLEMSGSKGEDKIHSSPNLNCYK